MTKYNEERLVSAPVAPVPFGFYQLEEDDVNLLKRYAQELKESPRKFRFQTSANVEEVYGASAFMEDVVGNIGLQSVKSLINQLPPNCRWKILESWVEYRKKGDFLPPTSVPGGDMAFSIWINIPYDMEEEMAHPRYKDCHNPCAAKTQMIYANPIGKIATRNFVFTKADEGVMLIYPSSILLQSFPFYTSDEECIVMRGSLVVEEIPLRN
jgi:hypothetical protein